MVHKKVVSMLQYERTKQCAKNLEAISINNAEKD